jgi:hypothetical protein
VLIDCDSCEVRGVACADCVVTVLLGMPVRPARSATSAGSSTSAGSATSARAAPVDLDDAERAAIGVLAESGLVPPLRLVPTAVEGAAAGSATYHGPHAGGTARAG